MTKITPGWEGARLWYVSYVLPYGMMKKEHLGIHLGGCLRNFCVSHLRETASPPFHYGIMFGGPFSLPISLL